MNSEEKDELKFSHHVSEIMGNPPPKIVERGTMVITGIIVLFFFFSWLIRYPDIVPSPVEITTENPPVTLVAKVTGRIKYLGVKDKEPVKPGQLLAVIETAASLEEVALLKHFMDTLSTSNLLSASLYPQFSRLGELQYYWSAFLKCLKDYNSFNLNDYYGNKMRSLGEEINALADYIKRLEVKEKLFAENLFLEEKKFMRDSILFATGVMSESDFEKARQSFIRINIDLQQVRLETAGKKIELAEKKQLYQDYKIKGNEEKERLAILTEEAFQNLKAQVRIWENTYQLISPVHGTVTFTKYWSENQSVVTDEPVLSIVPFESGDFIGRTYLRMHRSGKVMPGQDVNIKLSGYPYLEYGMVRGRVKSKSLVPSGDAYIIEISLPSGLTTLYGKKLDFTQNMQGVAEIITQDIRLIQKIVNPFRYLITRNFRN